MATRRDRQRQTQPEWTFRTFPVYFAFALGAFVSVLIFATFPGFSGVLFVVSLFGTSFGFAHFMTHQLRQRTIDRNREREEEDERERRALAARAAASQHNEASSVRRRRQRRRPPSNPSP